MEVKMWKCSQRVHTYTKAKWNLKFKDLFSVYIEFLDSEEHLDPD